MKRDALLVVLGSVAVCNAASNAFPATSEFPPCSINCFTTTLENDGCAESDFDCHCSLSGLYQNISTCVFNACDRPNANTFLDGFISACEGIGYPLKSAPTTLLLPTAAAATATTSATAAPSPSKGAAAGLVPTQIGSLLAGVLTVLALAHAT
ncbi:hypothetical protein RBB50_008996 [Rhinocladiella similis]